MKYLILFLLVPIASFSQNKGASPIAGSLEPTANKNTYAVVVGISDYQDKDIPDLRYADKDAEAFANFLRSPAGGSLDGDHIKVLTNQKATVAQFAMALDWLMEQAREGDNAIIYFSGHGDVEKKTLTQPGYLLCWDAPSRVYMAGGAFALHMLQEVVSTLSIQNKAKVTVIADACRSGTLAGQSIGGSQATAANLAKQYANEIKILSCQPNEYSIEGVQWGGGRGAFSFHLLNALYGLADVNNDLYVTLQEAGRYLEDYVTTEVAPVSQVPMVLGNRMERLSSVNGNLLADLRSGRTNQMAMLSPVEMRGLEEDVLAGADSALRKTYHLFNKALKDKIFFKGSSDNTSGNYADHYYARLIKEPKMARLQSALTRNYAAALHDDAQQAINIWLKADVQQLECNGESFRLNPIPRQLARAAELLGDGHYMYRSLNARRLLFEGISAIKQSNPDEHLGRNCLSLFRQSLEFESQSPLPWYHMESIYATHLQQPDSAFFCAHQAQKLAPNWVLPFVDLCFYFFMQNKVDLGKQALEKANAVDPLHPLVLERWANWHTLIGDKENLEKAVELSEKYLKSGGPLYSCWHNNYGFLLVDLRRYTEAEQQFLTAISLDSNKNVAWHNLGDLYLRTGRFEQAEQALKKSIALDSTLSDAWNKLGSMYIKINRFYEAESVVRKSIFLDPTNYAAWNNLGLMYNGTNRYEEALPNFEKAIALDSNYLSAWNNLGFAYLNISRFAEAEGALKKVIKLNPAIAIPRRHLGMVCFKTKRPDEARQHFLKAIALNPNYAGAMLGMACLLHSEGKTAEALGYIEQAISKGSTFDQLEKDPDLAPLRATPECKALMKKHFPDQIKD